MVKYLQDNDIGGYSGKNKSDLVALLKKSMQFGKRKKTVRKSKTVGKPVRKKTVHKKTVHKKKTVRRAR